MILRRAVCVQEVLCQERERCEGLQTQLSRMASTHETLRSKVTELEEANAVLQRENEELHSTAMPTGPSYRSALLQDKVWCSH